MVWLICILLSLLALIRFFGGDSGANVGGTAGLAIGDHAKR
ncbi:MAG: hypothetical protein ACLUYV_04435 [Alistipes shahii]